MKETDYWEQFLKTGKVEDYLSYSAGKQEEGRQEEGEEKGAGFVQCYRPDTEGGTFRGI